MVQIYFNLIKAGKKELSDVPEKLREQVKALLEADAE